MSSIINTPISSIGRMHYEEVHEDFYDTFRKFVVKLQKLPNADPVEIVAFSVLIIFIGKYNAINCSESFWIH